jgi:hypothetical protein
MYVTALVLVILAFSIFIVARRRRFRDAVPFPAPAEQGAGAPEMRETEVVEPETLAVIAAAARLAAGPGARVRKVRLQNGSTAWAEFGRMGIHGSHKIRKAPR